MALALRLGRTLSELCNTMSAAEFGLWLRFHSESPIDDNRADLRTGIIAATIANYSGKVRSESSEPARPIDYMPFVDKPADSVKSEIDPGEFFSSQAKLFEGNL